ncbi:hypothetical protein JXQ70_18055 [bacterium]|nr:hypothetical protein [bacterium]
MKNKRAWRSTLLLLLMVCFMGLVCLAQAQEQLESSTKSTKSQAMTQTPSGPQPEIKFDREDLTYDMGNIQQMGKGEIIIKFKNIGKAELKIHQVKAG